ncbi:MAG TPA: patatin-like phospholipase family protein [Moraxellaceae bacterium]
MNSDLHIAAGPAARRHLESNGLQLRDIRAMLGASGGPKWLVLNQLDRYLAPRLAADPEVNLDLLGTSIGSWRFACYAQNDPLAAFDRFEAAYFEQAYSAKPDAAEISRECGKILDALLGKQQADVLENTQRRLHTIANRCRPWMLDGAGQPSQWRLLLSALGNAVGREQLRHFFERVLFRTSASRLPWDDKRFVLEEAKLDAANLRQALMATASIPVLMQAIRDIPGTRGGACVDGGITDYHFDTPLSYGEGIVLYLHFSPRLVPGWFDKMLPWRRPSPQSLDNVLLVSPSADFISRLPGGRIPDRNDFLRLSPADRIAAWRRCLDQTRRLAELLDDRLRQQNWEDVAVLA